MTRFPRASLCRVAAATAAALFLLVAAPGRASAHAAFISSDPPPGAELSSAPGVVVLRFTEPLIERLSGAAVVDPDGRSHEGRVSGERQIQVPLATNAPGMYEVEWTTVSPVDGHTLRGSFRFGVGVSPGDGAEGATAAEPGRADLLIALARALEYGALLLALGMVLVRRLARRAPPLAWVRVRLIPVLGVAVTSGAAVVLGEALLAAGSLAPGALGAYFTSGVPGIARLVRVTVEAVALVVAMRGGSPALHLMVAVAALASAGHAAAVSPRWWGVTADGLHLLTAGLWAGGIMALATLRPPGGWRGEGGRALLDRFSPVALPAFAVTVAFGVVRGAQELETLGDLVATSYGRVLAIKVVAVVAMVPFSVLLWQRLRGTPRVEAGVAVGVIAMAALLAAYPLPPARLGEAEAGEERATDGRALPRDGDLTLGGEAGEVLVGLTLRPGEPGANDVLVYVLPLEGQDQAAGIPVTVSVGERTVDATECGPTCRRGRLELEGGEEMRVRVGGGAGGTEVFEIPSLPAPDGDRLFASMQERMHTLKTYRIEEVLNSGRATVEADYAFEAPDRMRIALGTGFERVVIGDRQWRREAPGAPWESSSAFPPTVPRFIWDVQGEPVATKILGRDGVDGTPATVLSFLAGRGTTPIWFRLWVDAEGLVHRAEMRAQGHFMDHRYFAFDAPLSIEPPTSGAGRTGPDKA
ncbi:MAG TPA: copper resistance protein CopC [Actinomycetota bacterium]|nr:copper resistance protein CopC [Actinomycetota bacterium]